MKKTIRKTRKAWNAPGHAHLLTYSCHNGIALLANDRARRWVVDALASARDSHDLDLWAYVIMPDHVHALLHPRQRNYEMRQILGALKRPVARRACEHLDAIGATDWIDRLTVEYPSRRVFRFWRPGGGFDQNVPRMKTARAAMRYIHLNPVRRGLVDREVDWKWSSARFWAGWPDVPIRMDMPLGSRSACEGICEGCVPLLGEQWHTLKSRRLTTSRPRQRQPSVPLL